MSSTGRVRPFHADDVLPVARLHQAVFKPEGRTDQGALESYRPYLTEVFLDSPFCDPGLPSLVHEDAGGRIIGFLGSAPRRLIVNGMRLQAAVSSQFVVDPASPIGLVAVRLAKAFLAGPQDVSIADEANDVSRRIWEGLGGSAALLLSLHWTRALRPARLAVSMLRKRGGALTPVGAVARPLANLADALATRVPRSHFFQRRDCNGAADLDRAAVARVVAELNQDQALHVEHDERTFGWLLDRAARARPGGRLVKTVLQDGRRIRGWYVWHLDREGSAELLHFKANPASAGDVLDHLFHDTWKLGASAVYGRLEPRFLEAFSDKYCLFHRRGPWMLAHAKRPERQQAILAGHVSFSRLDGEWALRF